MIAMIAHCPYPGRCRAKTVKLLRDPNHFPLTNEGGAEKTIADDANAESGKQGDGGAIERIVGRDPDLGFDPFPLEDLHPAPYFLLLVPGREAGEFRQLLDGNDARASGSVFVLESVQGKCPAPRLPLTRAFPKIFLWRINSKHGILIVGHNGQDGLESILGQSRFYFRPDCPIHGRADVVKTNQILGGFGVWHGEVLSFSREQALVFEEAPPGLVETETI